MNQILYVGNKYKKKIYKFIFRFSVVITILLFIIMCLKFFNINKDEKFSDSLIRNYDIYRLYSTQYVNHNIEESKISGLIEIPKINIKYPFFSYIDDELLKISPCKFYGNTPVDFGNLCIAGHNYDNSKFFSDLFLINIGDNIYIYDNLGNKYVYTVFNKYEVDDSDLSPIFDYNKFSKELTLVTCNNYNGRRLIVKAKQ